MTPEQHARVSIDALLRAAGWHVCHMLDANIHAARGVAIREFPLNPGYGYGYGFADYLLYIDGKAAGVIEAKKEGSTLTGVEVQSARYAKGLDTEPRARAVFAFHRPETRATFLVDLPAQDWVSGAAIDTRVDATTTALTTANDLGTENAMKLIASSAYSTSAIAFLGRKKAMPPLVEDGLWPAQVIAISFIYCLIKFGGAKRANDRAYGAYDYH